MAEVGSMGDRDAKLWTPAQALRSLLEQIECGDIEADRMYVVLMAPDDRLRHEVTFCVAGINDLEGLAMLDLLHEEVRADLISTKTCAHR